MTPPPLAGIRVVDFSRVLAGPFATLQLADLGATVTKVERPGTGDDTRSWGPPYDPRGQSTYFQSVNRGKASVVLDLADPTDRAAARRLAVTADVVVENFRPGLMARFGLDFDQLRPDNPGLVYCAVSGFGRGAGAALAGYDLLIQAVGGLMSITGEPAGEPQKVGVALVDVLTGSFATIGILAALRHRERTGEGQRVDVDLLTSLLAAMANQSTAYTSTGHVPTRHGNSHPSIAPYELLPTAEGDLVVAVGNDRQFVALCVVLGVAEVAEDDRFATNPARVEHRALLRDRLVRALSARTAVEWVPLLTAARVPAGQVNDIAGAYALAERLGLDPVVTTTRPDGSTVLLPRNPITFSLTPVVVGAAPPDLPS